MPTTDRWVMGLLLMALSAVLWFVILDTREAVRLVAVTVHVNSGRISSMEARVAAIEMMHAEIKSDLKEHRYRTEEQPNRNRKTEPH